MHHRHPEEPHSCAALEGSVACAGGRILRGSPKHAMFSHREASTSRDNGEAVARDDTGTTVDGPRFPDRCFRKFRARHDPADVFGLRYLRRRDQLRHGVARRAISCGPMNTPFRASRPRASKPFQYHDQQENRHGCLVLASAGAAVTTIQRNLTEWARAALAAAQRAALKKRAKRKKKAVKKKAAKRKAKI